MKVSDRLSLMLEGGGKWFMKTSLDDDKLGVAERYNLQVKDGMVSGTYKALKAFADEAGVTVKIEKKVKP